MIDLLWILDQVNFRLSAFSMKRSSTAVRSRGRYFLWHQQWDLVILEVNNFYCLDPSGWCCWKCMLKKNSIVSFFFVVWWHGSPEDHVFWIFGCNIFCYGCKLNLALIFHFPFKINLILSTVLKCYFKIQELDMPTICWCIFCNVGCCW